MNAPDERAAVLAAALKGANSFFDIYSRLHKAVPEGREEQYRSLIWAFGYDLISPEDPERRAREGSPFGAMFEIEGRRLPPRLADVEPEDVAVWTRMGDLVADPRAQARLGDLLWERREAPRPDLRARAACEAFVALSQDSEWEPMDSTDGLVRALELAAEVRDDDLRTRVVRAVVDASEAEMASEHDRPGVSLTLLAHLVELPGAAQPSALPRLLDVAEKKYGEDPHHFQAVLDLKAELAAPEEAMDLRRAQVENWRSVAESAEGILRMTFLETALDIARTHGLTDEANELRVELGNISDDDLGLKQISVETKIEAEQVNEFVEQFLAFDDWRHSLTRFGLHGPPGGEPEDIDRRVAERRAADPFQFLTTQVLVDPDTNAPLHRATDEQSHERAAHAQERLFSARLWSVLAVNVLGRFHEAYGCPSREELVQFFTSAIIDASAADRIAQSFEHYWRDEPNVAAHLLAPCLEAIFRELARKLGLPILDEPVGGRPGRTRSLGTILRSLEGRLPTAGWHAYLVALLNDQLGLNLRNVIAHGLRPQVSVEDAALLLHAACFLRLLSFEKTAGRNN